MRGRLLLKRAGIELCPVCVVSVVRFVAVYNAFHWRIGRPRGTSIF